MSTVKIWCTLWIIIYKRYLFYLHKIVFTFAISRVAKNCPGQKLPWTKIALAKNCPGQKLPWPKIAMAKNCHSADRVPNPFNSLLNATFFQTLTQPSHQISPHCTKNPLICYITKRKKLKVQCHIPQFNSRKIWKINSLFPYVSAKFKSLESKKMLCNAFYLSCQISKQKLCWIGYVLEDTF